jgi:thiopeptide-type bacteriocin biosynthesis protein
LRRGEPELSLSEEDLKALTPRRRPRVPDAFTAFATLLAPNTEAVRRGEFRVDLRGMIAASPADYFSRFFHADERLGELARSELRVQEEREPHVIFADLVHQPGTSAANLVFRPVLSAYEIPCAGASGAAPDRMLPLSELLLSVRDDQLRLRWARDHREVRVRVSTAHNYAVRSNFAVYRFLAQMSESRTARSFQWDWGQLGLYPRLPRVTYRKCILSPARWRIPCGHLRGLSRLDPVRRFQGIQHLRSELELPGIVAIGEGDRMLPINLDNPLCVELLLAEAKRGTHLHLEEALLGQDSLCVRSTQGERFCHQLVVPFLNREPAGALTHTPALRESQPEAAARVFAPGSEWLYVKLYCGRRTANSVLHEIVEPVAQEAMLRGWSDRWFFVRHNDPDWHVRARFHGASHQLLNHLLPVLHERAVPWLKDGRIKGLQLDTYDRELERYGGAAGLAVAEDVFWADSEACLALLRLTRDNPGADLTSSHALVGVHRLLVDFGFDLEERHELVTSIGEAFAAEFGIRGASETRVSAKCRQYRAHVEMLLSDGDLAPAEELLKGAPEVLSQRSARLRPLAATLRQLESAGALEVRLRDSVAAIVHMHVNRLISSSARAHEAVLYALLRRYYASMLARSGRDERRRVAE